MSDEYDLAPGEDRYIPWSEGATILDMKRGTFFYLVEAGKVRVQRGESPRKGRYSLRDILKVKQERESGKQRKTYRVKPKPVLLDWLTPADIPSSLKLDFELYGEIDYNPPREYQERQKKNSRIAMAAFSQDRSVCLGYVGLIPLPEQICLDLMAKKLSETAIPLEAVETYDRPGAYTLFTISAAIHPDRPDLLYKLLYRIMKFWIDQFPERYITRIYATTISPQGDMLVQHFFMSPMAGYPTDAYYLDMARPSASKIIRWYQKQLLERAPLPAVLTERYTPPLPTGVK